MATDDWKADLTADERKIVDGTFHAYGRFWLPDLHKMNREERLDHFKTISESDNQRFLEHVNVHMPGDQHAEFNRWAYDRAKTELGREPTADEFYKWSEAAGNTDRKAFDQIVFNQADQEEAEAPTPRIPGGDGEDAGVPDERTPEWAGERTTDIFQSMFGRDPDDDELQYYGGLLIQKDNPWQPYEMQQALKQTTEYRDIEDTQFREGLEGELREPTERFVEEQTPNILSKFARAGTLGSSALDFAVTDMLSDLAKRRETYLGGISASQYGGNKALARADYQNILNQILGEGQYKRGRRDYLSDLYTKRAFDVSDYNRQRDDYMNFLKSQGGKSGGFPWKAAATATGMGAGALIGQSPQWAMAGGQMAGTIPDFFDY